jgi:toluene monooxygenase system ferredoxin subunit
VTETAGDTATQQWHAVMALDDLWEGEMEAVVVEGTSVLLVNHEGDVYAYKNRCPHQEWPLNDGDLDERELTCANHLWVFDVTTGKGVNPANCALVGYRCTVDDDGMIQVNLG